MFHAVRKQKRRNFVIIVDEKRKCNFDYMSCSIFQPMVLILPYFPLFKLNQIVLYFTNINRLETCVTA